LFLASRTPSRHSRHNQNIRTGLICGSNDSFNHRIPRPHRILEPSLEMRMPLLRALGYARHRIVEHAVEELQIGKWPVVPVEDVLEELALGGDVAVFPFLDRINWIVTSKRTRLL